MKTFLGLLSCFLLLSAILYFRKQKSKFLEKALIIIHFLTLPLLIVTFILLGKNLRFSGQYTNTLIALVFLASGILLFGAARSKVISVYSGFIGIPALFMEVSLLMGTTPLLLPSFVAWLMFAPPKLSAKINNDYNFEIHEGGLMTSPNLFYLSQRNGLFDKKISLTKSNEHFEVISEVQVVKFAEDKYVICKIYCGNGKDFTIDSLQYEN